jgi:hypothetical protein
MVLMCSRGRLTYYGLFYSLGGFGYLGTLFHHPQGELGNGNLDLMYMRGLEGLQGIQVEHQHAF